MNHVAVPSRSNWLSLVAETAGVPGAAVARVQLGAIGVVGPVRAVVQVLDASDRVLGATYWYGEGTDLAAHATVDIGYEYDFIHREPLRVAAWIDGQLDIHPARYVVAPPHAAIRPYDRTAGLKLMLEEEHPAIHAAVGFVPEAA